MKKTSERSGSVFCLCSSFILHPSSFRSCAGGKEPACGDSIGAEAMNRYHEAGHPPATVRPRSTMSRLRTFIAVEVDERVRSRLVAVQQTLARAGGDVKWVEEDN